MQILSFNRGMFLLDFEDIHHDLLPCDLCLVIREHHLKRISQVSLSVMKSSHPQSPCFTPQIDSAMHKRWSEQLMILRMLIGPTGGSWLCLILYAELNHANEATSLGVYFPHNSQFFPNFFW